MFQLQFRSFEAVEHGNYDTFVPVVSHDEFSLIAQETNRMILGLRERERIRRAFGKYMGPPVAEAVLTSEQETNLGGRLVDVAVLFTDLRDFTPLSEQHTPHQVVEILNRFFGLVVRAVHDRQGVLDKFVGDAAMAVFGLDGRGNPCEQALAVAVDLREGLEALNAEHRERGLTELDFGIGAHYGPVIAGNIGSEERLEYTVIGDTVNTASRLEGVTRELPTNLAISGKVYEALPDAARAQLEYVTECSLKGKSEMLPVYGFAAA